MLANVIGRHEMKIVQMKNKTERERENENKNIAVKTASQNAVTIS